MDKLCISEFMNGFERVLNIKLELKGFNSDVLMPSECTSFRADILTRHSSLIAALHCSNYQEGVIVSAIRSTCVFPVLTSQNLLLNKAPEGTSILLHSIIVSC